MLAKKIYIKIGVILGFINQQPKKTKYKIGNVKVHNSLVDELIPQAVTIGDNFISAPRSIILAHDASTYNHTKKHRVEETVIGNNVFLGAGAIILPGLKIGDNVIIGAGSVVTKNVEENSVVAGNPARFMCTTEIYIKKCEQRGVLFDTPKSFEKFYSNKFTKAEVEDFQQKWIKTNM